jgi:hypothetical protein
MSFKATGVIQDPPNVMSNVKSATTATTHDERLSIEPDED